MSVQDLEACDCLVVGAGPVGLFLACELRLGGASVLVLERAQQPTSRHKNPPFGLRGLSAPSIEALNRRGLLPDVIAAQPSQLAAHWTGQARRPAGHFAGVPFHQDRINVEAWSHRFAGPNPASMAVTLQSLEAVLTARAQALGVEVRRGSMLEGLDALDDGVRARAGGKAFYCRWLVGCDGGRSAVRKLAGFDFTGSEPEFTGYSVEVELDDPSLLRAGRTHTTTGMYTFTRPGTVAMVEFDGGVHHQMQPVTRDHVQAVLRRVSETHVGVSELKSAATWTDRARQATTYRRGRVLLAGDAAHIHSPLGGQGLNLGLGDAMNLGWKLCATLRGDAPEGLLDSYTSERHPIGAQVLDWSRAQVALMRPDPGSCALRSVVGDLMETSDGATYFAGRVWGVDQRYDLRAGHPLVGRSVPDFELSDGAHVGALLGAGRGLLLDFGSHEPLKALASRYMGRIDYAARRARDRRGVDALLIRPDGVVAWAAQAAADIATAAGPAMRWFGGPSSLSVAS